MGAWERLTELLRSPFRRRCAVTLRMRILRVPRSLTDEHVQRSERGRDHNEKSHAAITRAWLRTNVSHRCLDQACEAGHRRAARKAPKSTTAPVGHICRVSQVRMLLASSVAEAARRCGLFVLS
jgi:hypothetical protein